MNILALDPSTVSTGLAIVHFDKMDEPYIIIATALVASSERCAPQMSAHMKRAARIGGQRRAMKRILDRLGGSGSIDIIAYEQCHGGVGNITASNAVNQAIGALISTDHEKFAHLLDIISVTSGEVKSAIGYKMPKGKKGERLRADAKAGCQRLLRERFGVELGEDAADAVGVALACKRKLQIREVEDEALRIHARTMRDEKRSRKASLSVS